MLPTIGLNMHASLKPVIVLVFACTATWTGCGPRVERDDLGEVMFEIPTVPGGDEPYRLPQTASAPTNNPTIRRVSGIRASHYWLDWTGGCAGEAVCGPVVAIAGRGGSYGAD